MISGKVHNARQVLLRAARDTTGDKQGTLRAAAQRQADLLAAVRDAPDSPDTCAAIWINTSHGGSPEMDLLVTYDVDTTPDGQNRLRRVAKICEAYGHRVQKSVFEIVIRDADKLHLVAKLGATINHDLDSVRIYRLPARALDDVEHIGLSRQVDPRGPLVI